MVSPLDRKLLRDLWRIRGQMAAIALVISAGVAMYVMSLSAFDSLDLTQRTYYERFRFGDVFASLKRAPLRIVREIEEIPGVAQVEARVVVDVTLDVSGMREPATGRLLALPRRGRPTVNDLHVIRGRWIESGHHDEVLLSETFATIHGLEPGETLNAVINGRRKRLRIVGLALSPEFVYSIRPGELIPDDRRFGVLWMARDPLAAAFDMEGGFNDVALVLRRDASTDEVIERLDHLLEPYGGLGAIPRKLQISHFYLQNELDSLKGMGAILPLVFLGVAAFLLQSVLSRIIALQREQIAALKALGYSNAALALHYVKWALVAAVAGAALGVAGGVWIGSGLTRIYATFFHFPILQYRLLPSTAVEAVSISLLAAVVGALFAVRRAVRLQPAEAMRPEPPANYRPSVVEAIGLGGWFSQPSRMILRNLQRHRWRTLLSIVGIAFGGAMYVVGSFSSDAIDEMMELQFNVAERQDASISFFEPRSSAGLHELRRLPGVLDAEPFRSVPVRLRHGSRQRRTAITGHSRDARLHRLVDADFSLVGLPPDGLVLSARLGQVLGIEPGDTVVAEVLEGSQPVREIVVAGLIEDMLGTQAYMDGEALHRLLREGRSLSGAYLQVDASRVDELYLRLKNMPAVAGVALKEAAVRSFEETFAENFAIIGFFNVLFAAVIAFGVVYNSARISLSERDRELATLRVIGFTRAEISYILLGELALVTLVAVPLGLVLGYAFAALTAQAYDTDVFRIPLVVAPRTFAYSALTVLSATLVSGYVVRRRLDSLDLVAVLKTRE